MTYFGMLGKHDIFWNVRLTYFGMLGKHDIFWNVR